MDYRSSSVLAFQVEDFGYRLAFEIGLAALARSKKNWGTPPRPPACGARNEYTAPLASTHSAFARTCELGGNTAGCRPLASCELGMTGCMADRRFPSFPRSTPAHRAERARAGVGGASPRPYGEPARERMDGG